MQSRGIAPPLALAERPQSKAGRADRRADFGTSWCLPVKPGNVKPRDPWVLPIATQNHVSCDAVGVWGGILMGVQSRFALGSLGENTQPHK